METQRRRDFYSGETENLLRHGFGVYSYDNSFFRYEGEWFKGKKHGHGKLTMNDGSYYEGQFHEGEICGYGSRHWTASNNHYDGQFFMGELHGEGSMEYGSGGRYVGQWFRNTRQGRGTWHMKNGDIFKGEFFENKRHGEGEQQYQDGSLYVGYWLADVRHGLGHWTEATGSTYHGRFDNNVFSGEGEMRHVSGIIYQGNWCQGRPERLAHKLLLDCAEPIECLQGNTFEVAALVVDVDGNTVTEENDRELKISAGFRYYPAPPLETGASEEEVNKRSQEDYLESLDLISTPYGYSVVPFPMMEAPSVSMKSRSLSAGMMLEEEMEENVDDAGHISDDEVAESPNISRIPSGRTESGKIEWKTLLLLPAPANYAPYVRMEKLNVFTDNANSAQPPHSGKAKKPTGEDAQSSGSRQSNQRFIRPGEYVIIIEDMTRPHFFADEPLAPLFLRVQLRPSQHSSTQLLSVKKEEKKRRWSTKQTIANAMIQQ